MTEKEHEELERRIAERNRIRAMVDDMEAAKKEAQAHRTRESVRARVEGEKPFGESGGSTGRAHSSGGAFEREQFRTGNH